MENIAVRENRSDDLGESDHQADTAHGGRAAHKHGGQPAGTDPVYEAHHQHGQQGEGHQVGKAPSQGGGAVSVNCKGNEHAADSGNLLKAQLRRFQGAALIRRFQGAEQALGGIPADF